MNVFHARNVNHALPLAIQAFKQHGGKALATPSRNGPTLEWGEPVTTVYDKPMERVLFDPLRDANPFFHLFESMWILAGRRDVRFLAHILPNIRNYSDDGERFHGAYGHRLRAGPARDQLAKVISLLRKDLTTRRAICAVWDPELDLGTDSADLPCNDMLAFRARDGQLDLTVYNRSNDVIWGAYGANAVQFAFILEFVAASVGVPPGRYYQVSNSFHVYLNDQWEKLQPLSPATVVDPYEEDHFRRTDLPHVEWMPMGDPWSIMLDISWFFHYIDRDMGPHAHTFRDGLAYRTEWANEVLIPAWEAFQTYKTGDKHATLIVSAGAGASTPSKADRVASALDVVRKVAATDWRLAMEEWLKRRLT